jgi:hypothetical protein
MKKLLVTLCALAMMVPMLSYAQSNASHAPSMRAANDQASQIEHAMRAGWITQPSAEALGQGLYKHH